MTVLSKYLGNPGRNNQWLTESDLFENFLNRNFFEPGFGTGWVPAIDVEESEDAFIIRAEMPGLKKEDVKVSLVNNILTLSGEKKKEEKKDQHKYHRTERMYGMFQRSFSLPQIYQANKIEANFKDGILVITVPKTEEAKPKEIAIQVK
jgi:HSP20 family protein